MTGWGILGAGNIARRFAASLAHEPEARLAAVSCRTAEKAQAFAAQYGAARAYGDYAALLADPQVQAVYLALPHGLHREWAIRAMRAGKAVLCEKPAGLCAADVAAMAQTARECGVLFMEAMKTRFVPLYGQIRALVDSGALGELTAVEASYCNAMPAELLTPPGKTYHTQPEQGGALLDGGIYCANWLAEFLPGAVTRGRVVAGLRGGVDHYVDAALQIGGIPARLEAAFDRAKPRTATLRGTKGTLVVEELHRPQRAVLYRGGQAVQTLHAPYIVDDFYGQIHHFTECLREGRTESPVMPHAASLRCAQILDAVRAGFTYEEQDLAVLQAQEDLLQYPAFGSAQALVLGNAVAACAADYDREIAVQIVRERDGATLFQYVMDGKSTKNLDYMAGKRAAAKACGHSSLWAWVDHALHGSWQALIDGAPQTLPCAGAFPIRAQGEWVATLCVSGLHEGLDHEIMIRALCRALGREAPAFLKAAQ